MEDFIFQWDIRFKKSFPPIYQKDLYPEKTPEKYRIEGRAFQNRDDFFC